jgi:hypothetical protein
VAGRLAATLWGEPVTLDASDRTVVIHLPRLGLAWRLRRYATTMLAPLPRRTGLRIMVRVGGRGPMLRLWPDPPALVRLLLR